MKSLKVNVKNNAKFRFLTEILDLKSLHYGYWENPPYTDFTFNEMKSAQGRYTETLVEMIPEGVRDILDVGCGVGDVSHAMAGMGFNVTSLSPDINHKQYFENNNKNIKFHNQKFENFNGEKKFDLILMSESQNYFDTDIGLTQCRRYLRDGGYLLISGMFRKENIPLFDKVRNIEKPYIEEALQYDLNLIYSIDITKNTLPTLHYQEKIYKKYIVPSYEIFRDLLGRGTRFKLFLLKTFFKREYRIIIKSIHYYEERMNSKLFDKHVKYLRLLFRKK